MFGPAGGGGAYTLVTGKRGTGMAETFTTRDLHREVAAAIDGIDGTYDIDGIVDSLVEKHEGVIRLRAVDSNVFWGIVIRHEVREGE